MKRFFDGTDQENSKNTKEERDRSGKFQKKQEGKNEVKKKKRRFPYSCVLERPWATALVQLSLRGTHSNGNLPYNKRQRHGIFVIFINSFKWILGFYHGTNLTLP